MRSLRAFPAGTVSGAPKVRAMEIIDELEKEKRGLYAGCVGYFSAAGDMDSCIVLRTALIKDGKMYVQAGAGIVADSDPASEQQECINKAKALFRAAEEAGRFASTAAQGAVIQPPRLLSFIASGKPAVRFPEPFNLPLRQALARIMHDAGRFSTFVGESHTFAPTG